MRVFRNVFSLGRGRNSNCCGMTNDAPPKIGVFFTVLDLAMIVFGGPVLAKVGKIFSDKALMALAEYA